MGKTRRQIVGARGTVSKKGRGGKTTIIRRTVRTILKSSKEEENGEN